MKFDSHDCPIRKLRIILSFFAKKSQLGYEKYWIHEAFFWCHDQMKIGISKWSGISYFFFSKEFKRTLGGRKRDRSRGRFVISFRFSVTHVFHECYRRDRYANSRSHRKERIDSTAFFYLVVQNGVRFVRGRKPLADDSISAPRSSPPPPPLKKKKKTKKKASRKALERMGSASRLLLLGRSFERRDEKQIDFRSARYFFSLLSFFLSFFFLVVHLQKNSATWIPGPRRRNRGPMRRTLLRHDDEKKKNI